MVVESRTILKSVTPNLDLTSAKNGSALRTNLFQVSSTFGSNNISLEIIVKKDLDAYGYCCHLDTEGKARNFEIELKEDKCVNDLLSTLAHEMVHLKQYATGHLKDIANSPKIKWGKRVYESIVPETLKSYYATPWEKEACAKEKKLFGKFKQAFPHFKNTNL